jgi:ammonia channel protein AmtB
MKKINWRIVMFVAVIAMLAGLCISFLGLEKNQENLVFTGLAIIAVVCVSWWFWVMFVIKTMLHINDKTTTGIIDIKTKLGELKALIQDITSKHKE